MILLIGVGAVCASTAVVVVTCMFSSQLSRTDGFEA